MTYTAVFLKLTSPRMNERTHSTCRVSFVFHRKCQCDVPASWRTSWFE